MTQKTKDLNVILERYYIHLIHFSNEEDDSASANNEENSKNSRKKRDHHRKDLNQKSASFLQNRLSSLIKILLKPNAQNRKNIES